MKQFNLTEYIANPSKKVVTRDGKNVRIICTDAKGLYPIIALIEIPDGTAEEAVSYTKSGHFYSTEEDSRDLFFASEKNEGWVNIYKNYTGFRFPSHIYQTKKDAENAGGDVGNGYITTIKIEWEE